MSDDEKDWILIDGFCGLCRRFGAWVRRHDDQGRFYVIPYQDAPSPPMTEELRQGSERVLHVLKPDGTVLRADQAVLYIYEQLGYRLPVALLRTPPLSWLSAPGYQVVANNRRFFAKFTFRTPEDRGQRV